MRRHPQDAYDMLSPITFLRPALDIPYCHHEKWDGTGYPRGLRGNEIPLAPAFSPLWMSGMPCAPTVLIALLVRGKGAGPHPLSLRHAL